MHDRTGINVKIKLTFIRLWNNYELFLRWVWLILLPFVYLSTYKDAQLRERRMSGEKLVWNSSQTGRRRLSRAKWAAGTRVFLFFLLNSQLTRAMSIVFDRSWFTRSWWSRVLWNDRFANFSTYNWLIMLWNIIILYWNNDYTWNINYIEINIKIFITKA